MTARTLFDLDGRVALVVGAGRGIGAAAARGLSEYGARVVCADVDLSTVTGPICLARGPGW